MNFDIKDLKSWANRHDVKIKSVTGFITGFFGNSLLEIDNEIRRYKKGEKGHLHELYQISDNGCFCFGYATYFADTGAFGGTNNFAFFLPLDAIKEDKTYRACRTAQELYELVFNTKSKAEESFYIEELLSAIIHLRNKETGTEYFTTISTITKDINDYIKVVVSLKGYLSFGYLSFTDLFNKYEIEINGEWKPFGTVEDCTGE